MRPESGVDFALKICVDVVSVISVVQWVSSCLSFFCVWVWCEVLGVCVCVRLLYLDLFVFCVSGVCGVCVYIFDACFVFVCVVQGIMCDLWVVFVRACVRVRVRACARACVCVTRLCVIFDVWGAFIVSNKPNQLQKFKSNTPVCLLSSVSPLPSWWRNGIIIWYGSFLWSVKSPSLLWPTWYSSFWSSDFSPWYNRWLAAVSGPVAVPMLICGASSMAFTGVWVCACVRVCVGVCEWKLY